MLALLKLSLASPTFPLAESLYTEAFPTEERRPLEAWRLLVEEEPAFHIYEIHSANGFAGFVCYWELAGFIFVEHFAIRSALRCCGVGRECIEHLKEKFAPLPLVLEAELPESEMACRRIGFYARCGFSPSPRPYLQPPYRRGDSWLPLLLLCTDETFLSQHFPTIRQQIYHSVYHCETPSEEA